MFAPLGANPANAVVSLNDAALAQARNLNLSLRAYICHVTSPRVPGTLQGARRAVLRPNRTPCKSYTVTLGCRTRNASHALLDPPPLSQDAVAVVAFLLNPAADSAEAMLMSFHPSMYAVGISSRRGMAAKTRRMCLFFGLLTPRGQSFKSNDARQRTSGTEKRQRAS